MQHPRPPQTIFSATELTTGARLLFLAMWYDASPDDVGRSRTHAFATKARLASRLGGVARSTLDRWLRELRDQGWLVEADETSVRAWDLHAHADGRDPAPTRESSPRPRPNGRNARTIKGAPKPLSKDKRTLVEAHA